MFRLINPCHSANPWHLLRNNLFPSVKRAASKRNYSNAIQIQRMNKKHDTLYYVGSVIITFFGLTYLSVPLYKLLCTTTGFDGTPITAKGTKFLPESMVPVLKSRPITITFDASLADTMRWTFRPETRQIKVLPGETSLSFFKASNPTNEDIVGISTYSVVPSKAAQYFNKVSVI